MRDVVAWLLEHACELTGHAGGCALLNSGPSRRLWGWALDPERIDA